MSDLPNLEETVEGMIGLANSLGGDEQDVIEDALALLQAQRDENERLKQLACEHPHLGGECSQCGFLDASTIPSRIPQRSHRYGLPSHD